MKPVLLMNRLGLLLFILIAGTAYGQETQKRIEKQKVRLEADKRINRIRFSEERGTPSFISLEQPGVVTENTMTMLQEILDLKTGTENLVPVKSSTHPGGIQTMEFQQYFKGIKVEHAIFKAMVKQGKIHFLNGIYYDIPGTVSVVPALSEENALKFALKAMPANLYAWEDLQEKAASASTKALHEALEKAKLEYLPKGSLVFVKDFNKKETATIRLAYKFNIYAAEPLGRAWIYIDAENGKTLLRDDIIKHVDNPNPNPPASVSTIVQTRYAGTQSIKTKLITGSDPNSHLLLTASNPLELYLPGTATYALIDDTRGNGIETYDLNGVGGVPFNIGAFYAQGKSFTDVDNNWTLAEHHRSPTNGGAAEMENDDIAWDAHWGAEVVYDYWLTKHNRRSYDDKDTKIKSFIHYGPAYDNAFWNGEAMTYGDGSGALYKPLMSLDVCGHEIGHAICSSTSDLVYQRESGAMNEALSDIWAACIEHFAMTRTGSTVPPTAYRPFYVGEQIAANPNSPLRRMDNPKAKTDPDTYGGTYWSDPTCVPEQNTNDNCGVHTNSGVLNHWFFLMTAGSRSGTRPAGMTSNQYYFPDSDDEINDLGNVYSVNGIGFDYAEQITFLMETMLSSTATYAEAREVSIAAATEITGDPCGAIVESVTNAWYAVGVGDKFNPVCTATYGFIGKLSSAVSETVTPAGCNSQKAVNIPIVLPANSSATVTTSGSATNGQDYSLASSSVSNTTNTNNKVYITVNIKNDAIIENDETVNLQVSVANAGGSPVNAAYSLTITDDDVIPVIGTGSRQLLSENFNQPDGYGGPAGWNTVVEIPEDASDPTAFTGHNHWELAAGQLVVTGKEPLTGLALPAGNYYDNSESKTYVQTPLIDASGLSIINVHFDYRIQGEVDPQKINLSEPDIEKLPVFDYMTVMYSFDGVNWVELEQGDFRKFASALPESGSFNGILPAALANKKFYLAFRWYNDTNAGGPESVKIDNLEVSGSPRTLENEPGHNSRENLGAGNEVYFYSVQDGQVLGKINNNTIKNYGCTNLFIEKAGNGSFNLYQGRDAIHKVSEKILRIEPSVSYKGNVNIVVYLTEEQVNALEIATDRSRTEFFVYQVGAAAYTLAASNNTKKFVPVVNSFNGVVSFTFTLGNDNLSGSYAVGCPVTLFATQRPVITPETNAAGWKFTAVYPNPANGKVYLEVNTSHDQPVIIEVINSIGQVIISQKENLFAGNRKIALRVEKLAGGSYMIRTKAADGSLLDNQTFIKH
jgi:Zn-dependent metalloprotease